MKKIETIEIKNFKSIRQAEIKDCRKINLFIGYPNVGKSNILEALGLFTIESINLNLKHKLRGDSLTSIFFNGDINNKAQIILNGEDRIEGFYNYNDQVQFIYKYDRNKVGFEKYDRNAEKGVSLNDMDVDEIMKFQVSSDFKVNAYSGRNYRKINRIGATENSVIKKYDFIKNTLFQKGPSFELTQPNGENIFEVISANKKLREEVSELFKDYDLNFSFDKSTQNFKILKFIGGDIFIIGYDMIADTLQRLIFYKSAIQSNKNNILVFEEPEAHMFPPYIRKLTSDIVFDNNDNQYFIATHSPYVLEELISEAGKDLSVYLVGYQKGETTVKHLSDEALGEVREYGVDLFFNLEDYLQDG